MKKEFFKKQILIGSILCLIYVFAVNAKDKNITFCQQDLTGIKKIAIFVEQKREFEVFHWRAKTAYGTASALGGFEGDAIAHGIDKGKDEKEAKPMLDSIKDISCSEAFIASLKAIKDSNQFEKVDIKTGEAPKSEDGYDAVIGFTINKWGIRLVERDAEKLAGFVELEVKMTKPKEKKPIWDERQVVVGSKKETIDAFTSNGKMLNEEVRAAIAKVGTQMSNTLLYPSTFASDAKAEPKKEKEKDKKVKPESLEINNDINFKTGPLASIKPLKIEVVPFTDNRQTKNKIGELRNGFGMKAGLVNTAKPAPEIVQEAITKVFVKNGQTISSGDKDIVVTGSVDTYWFESQLRMSSWELMGTIDINLVVKDNKGKTLFTKKYSGHNDKVIGLFWPKTIIEIMDAAMANLTDQIPYDTQLIDALKARQK